MALDDVENSLSAFVDTSKCLICSPDEDLRAWSRAVMALEEALGIPQIASVLTSGNEVGKKSGRNGNWVLGLRSYWHNSLTWPSLLLAQRSYSTTFFENYSVKFNAVYVNLSRISGCCAYPRKGIRKVDNRKCGFLSLCSRLTGA